MDEIIHDLTPYGYEPIGSDESQEPIVFNGMSDERYNSDIVLNDNTHVKDNRIRYTKIDANIVHDDKQLVFDNVVYGSDVIADIIVNGKDEKVKTELIDRTSEKVPANYIRSIANETPITRRIMLLKRKTISRDTKKIVKIIIDNPINMVVSPDDIADMSIRGDDPIDMTIKHDEVEIFVPKK